MDYRSSRPKLYLTSLLPKELLNMLEKNYEINVHSTRKAPTKEEIKESIKDVDALICVLRDKIDSEIIAVADKIKIISCCSAGYEHVDLQAAKERNITVTNTPDVYVKTTAELAFALILSLSRRIIEAARYVRDDRWEYGWEYNLFLGKDLHGSTLGIIGLGRIGSVIAKYAKTFDMNVIYYNDEKRNHFMEDLLGVKYVSLDNLLSVSDFISINVDGKKKNLGMINKSKLELMKQKKPFIINTSRGDVISENDLIEGLENGWISGAGLDVHANEPSRPEKLLKFDNVVMLPHIGTGTMRTRTEMAIIAAQNVINYLNNSSPVYAVPGF